jgi:predicted TPR repeat methyltransferase
MADHDGHLGQVYGAQSRAEIGALYDSWAATYDADMAAAQYRHPSIALALLARHAAARGPVLDAGCGTGLLGDWLGILGFGPLHGLDLSAGMLAIARAKGAYAALHQAALGDPLPFADASFAAILSTGVFTTGHVGIEGVPELTRILRPGGILVLTVKMSLWDSGFGDGLAALPGLTTIAQTAPYQSMPGLAQTVPALAIVLRRT